MGLHTFSLPDALMAERHLALGLICDGIHVHPKLMQILAQLPEDRVFLETDANKFAGAVETEFEFYPGYWVRSAPGKAVLDRNGGLCGSSLTPDEAMRNYVGSWAPTSRGRHMPPAWCRPGCWGWTRIWAASRSASLPISPCSIHCRWRSSRPIVGGEALYRRAA